MATSQSLQAASLALILFSGAAVARAGHHGTSVSIDDGRDPQRCDQISIEIGDRPAERAEERAVIPSVSGKTLRVRIPEHSGANVRGTDRADFEVLVCKAARTPEQLPRISLSRKNDTVTVEGPDGDDWVGYLLIAAPRKASIELSADNGPIGLTNLSGHVTARSLNGPISIRNCAGDIDAEAENGPIHVRGEGGNVRLHTENGPIGVSLSGASWKGAGLEASAVNGPLSLAIPAGYRSGTTVESLGHSPFRCRGDACAGARRTWDDDHKRIELGEGPAVVRLSTENGPVSVKTGRDLDEGDDDED
jgi:hypothetical protein